MPTLAVWYPKTLPRPVSTLTANRDGITDLHDILVIGLNFHHALPPATTCLSQRPAGAPRGLVQHPDSPPAQRMYGYFGISWYLAQPGVIPPDTQTLNYGSWGAMQSDCNPATTSGPRVQRRQCTWEFSYLPRSQVLQIP